MFGAHVVVVEPPRFKDGVFNDVLGPRRLRKLPHRDRRWPRLNQLFNFSSHLSKIDIEILQDIRPDSASFLDQTKEDVLSTDVLVIEPLSLLVGQSHDLPGAIRESFEHGEPPTT